MGLNLCLLFGIVLFISVAVCTPMFEKGSYNRLIQNKYDDAIIENNVWPMTVSRTEKMVSKEVQDTDVYIETCNNYADYWSEQLPVDEIIRFLTYSTASSYVIDTSLTIKNTL